MSISRASETPFLAYPLGARFPCVWLFRAGEYSCISSAAHHRVPFHGVTSVPKRVDTQSPMSIMDTGGIITCSYTGTTLV